MIKTSHLLLISIFILSSILRLYKATTIPPGLYLDEISIGYNAYSVLKTGIDEHGQFIPLWFKAFGEYKMPVYIYLVVLSEFLFGINEFALRFPSVFAGIFTVIIFYFLVDKIYSNNKKISLLSSFLLAISPWHIHFSRAGFEVNVMVLFITLAIYLFIRANKSRSKKEILFSILFFILATYTYNAARIIAPLILITLLYFYKDNNKLINRKYISLFLLLVLPTFIFFLSKEGFSRANSVNYWQEITLSEETNMMTKYYLYLKGYLLNYSRYLSTDFLFVSGDQQGRHSAREMGQLFFWQLPLIYFSVSYYFKTKGIKIFLSLLLINIIPAALAIPSPHALRSLLSIIPYSFFSAVGLWVILKGINSFILKNIISVLLTSVIIYFLISYFHMYYIHYPKKAYLDWQDGYKDMVLSIKPIKDNYDQIIVTNEYGHPYLYFLFYLKIDPNDYIKRIEKNNNFLNFKFVKSPYTQDLKGKVLYVAAPWEKVQGKFIKDILFINKDIAFKIWEL